MPTSRAAAGESSRSAARVSVRGACSGACGPHLAVARLGRSNQRIDQAPRHGRDVLDRAVENRLIGVRWSGETGELAHELHRGGANLLVGRGRIEVEEGSNIAAHTDIFPHPLHGCQSRSTRFSRTLKRPPQNRRPLAAAKGWRPFCTMTRGGKTMNVNQLMTPDP